MGIFMVFVFWPTLMVALLLLAMAFVEWYAPKRAEKLRRERIAEQAAWQKIAPPAGARRSEPKEEKVAV